MSDSDTRQAWDEVERTLVELADVLTYSRHTVTLVQSCASLVRDLRKACEEREAELTRPCSHLCGHGDEAAHCMVCFQIATEDAAKGGRGG